MNESVLDTQDLTRYFGTKCAVDNVNLSVPKGCVYAFLGRNGAGKTTTIRMLLGFLPPTRGSSTVLGYDSTRIPAQQRARIGYVSERHFVYGWMTVSECEKFQSKFFPKWNFELFRSVVDYFGLQPKAKAKHLSRGERAGLCLALAMAPEPELLVLDDPALGLDPVAHRALLEFIVYLTRKQDRTIFFSTHNPHDVERMADRVGIMKRAHLRESCSLDDFRQRIRKFVIRTNGAPIQISNISGLLWHAQRDDELTLVVYGEQINIQDQLRDIRINHIEEAHMAFDEALVYYLGGESARSLLLQKDSQSC